MISLTSLNQLKGSLTYFEFLNTFKDCSDERIEIQSLKELPRMIKYYGLMCSAISEIACFEIKEDNDAKKEKILKPIQSALIERVDRYERFFNIKPL